jgi:DNA-binding transcriptional LysR family regulator
MPERLNLRHLEFFVAAAEAGTMTRAAGELHVSQPAARAKGLALTAGVTPCVRHRSASFEMVRSLVARGRGFSMLIQRPAVELSHEGLPIVRKPIRDPLPEMAVVLATPVGAHFSRRAAAFVEYCRELAPELGLPAPRPRR